MPDEGKITQEHFKLLLHWLDADENAAATKYEKIRERLIRVFAGRGCSEAEALADRTFDRVTLKVREVSASYEGDPALYFYGVGQNIFHEWTRTRTVSTKREIAASPTETERPLRELEYGCLESCLADLTRDKRNMILEYYQDEKRKRIDGRKLLAHKLGVSPAALHIRVCRLRMRLQKCVSKCSRAKN